MAILTITSSNWEVGQIRITYTASNGTLTITEIEGKRSGGYRSWDANDTSITVSVGGISKSISLSHCVDFGNNEWTAWGATDTSWTELSDTSISITTTMQSSTTAYSGANFTGDATMSWSTYTITYDANGGTDAPSNQTKTYGETIYFSSTIPTRTGYTFVNWCTSSDGSGDWAAPNDLYTHNSDVTLYAMWTPNIARLIYVLNGGTVTSSEYGDNGWGSITYEGTAFFHSIAYGNKDNPINASSFGLVREGYTFAGWQVLSTGQVLDQDTDYDSTVYTQYDDASKTTANTQIVDCHLYAQWTQTSITNFAFIKVNGEWIPHETYVKKSNEWVQLTEVKKY